MSIILEDDDVPPQQERVTTHPPTADRLASPDFWSCWSCWYSVPAVGSLRGIWLFCDHPESFKRYVRPDETCECWMLSAFERRDKDCEGEKAP
jgi:hypothetical protein